MADDVPIVIWCGPVSASNLAKAKWVSPVQVLTISFSGSDAGASLGATYKSEGGTALRGLLKRHGIDVDTKRTIVVAGFSAGHGLIEQILKDTDAERVGAVGAFDAYYTSAAKVPKPGYLRFAKRAAAGECAMLLTCSHNAGPTYPSCADASAALVAGLGLEPVSIAEVPPTVLESASAKGGLTRAVYGNRGGLVTTHVQHATILAPAFLPSLVRRASRSSGGTIATPDGGNDGGIVPLLFVAGVGVAWLASEQ